MEWKDGTAYAQGERGKRKPSCFKIGDDMVSLAILTGHLHDPEHWVINLRARDLSAFALGPADMTNEHARSMAIKVLETWRKKVNAAVDAIIAAGEIPDQPKDY